MRRKLSLLLACVMVLTMCYIPVYAADNLALNKPVTATSEWGGAYLMECVNDGKMSTSWSAGSVSLNPKDKDGNSWIQIDLGARYDITSMIAYSRSDVNSASERMGWIYQVSETADFAEKVVIGTKKSAGTPGSGYEAKPVEPATGRYVRVACPTYYVIAEIEVYGTPAAAVAKGEYNDIKAEGDLYNASQLAYNLGIMEGVSGADFGVNHLMTRAEAAQVAAKLGNSGELKPTDTNFSDVTAEHKLSGYVAWCENSMVVSKYGEFRPDDFVTGTEFVTMLLRLNGLWEAAADGPYPEIVQTLATKSDLLDGVDIVLENDINRGQALILIHNLLLTKRIEAIGVEENGVIYERGGIYLDEIFGLELLDGIVTSNQFSDLAEPIEGSDGYVTIDGDRYADTTGKMNAFLGERVWYLLDPDTDKIVGAWRNPDIGSSVTIQCADVKSSDEGAVIYWVGDKEKKLRLNAPVYFIKNGIASGDYTPDNLKRTNGKLVFIDNDDDGVYDVIKLYEPQIMVLDYISESNDKFTIGDQNGNVFVSDKYETVSAFLNGFDIKPSELGSDLLVYIYESDDSRYIEIEASNVTVTGTVEIKYDDSVIIDGTEYEYSQYYIDNADDMDKVSVGAEITLLLDESNKVVWVINDNYVVPPETLGVIYDMADSDGFSNCKFKIFNQNAEHLILTAAGEVTIDGIKRDVEDVRSLGQDYFIGKAIIYKLNGDREIRWMDTENYNATAEPDSWLISQPKWSLPSGSVRNAIGFYTSDGASMVMPFYEDYKVFTLPVDASTSQLITNDKLLGRYTYRDMSSLVAVNDNTGSSGTYTFYGNPDDDSPKLGVRRTNTSTTTNVKPVSSYTSNNVLVVETIGKYVTDSGMICDFIEGYNPSSGLTVKIKMPEDLDLVLDSHIIYTNRANGVSNPGISYTGLNYVSSTASTDLLSYASPVEDLNVGDVLRYEATSGVATAVERIYSTEAGSPSMSFNGMFINTGDSYMQAFRAGFRAVSANVGRLDSGILTVGSESFKYADSGAKHFICVEDGEIFTDQIEALPIYVGTGDRVLMIMLSGKVSYIIAYK